MHRHLCLCGKNNALNFKLLGHIYESSSFSEKHFKIFSASENLPFLEENLPALREKLGSDVEVELMYDAALSSDGCRIETEYGVFDCGIDTELANIYKDIRSLCG